MSLAAATEPYLSTFVTAEIAFSVGLMFSADRASELSMTPMSNGSASVTDRITTRIEIRQWTLQSECVEA